MAAEILVQLLFVCLSSSLSKAVASLHGGPLTCECAISEDLRPQLQLFLGRIMDTLLMPGSTNVTFVSACDPNATCTMQSGDSGQANYRTKAYCFQAAFGGLEPQSWLNVKGCFSLYRNRKVQPYYDAEEITTKAKFRFQKNLFFNGVGICDTTMCNLLPL